MRVWARIGYISVGACFAIWLTLLAIWGDSNHELSLWPYPTLCSILAIICGLGAASWLTLSLVMNRPTTPTQPSKRAMSSGLSITVPGLTKRGALSAMLNIRDRSHRVTWTTNGTFAGVLRPSDRGPTFDVFDADENHLGQSEDVSSGLELIEKVARE
jgi:hypothetical protein